jgi:ATP-dependent DNA ligase
MPSLVRELAAIPIESAWFDGEVVVQQANGLPDFNALQNGFDEKQGSDAMTTSCSMCSSWTVRIYDLRRSGLAAKCWRPS